MAKILTKSQENHKAQLPKVSVFICQKSIFRHYCIQNVKDGIQIQACNVTNECLTYFSQFISGKVKQYLKKAQAQFREKLRKLRLRKNDGFLIKKRIFCFPHFSLRFVPFYLFISLILVHCNYNWHFIGFYLSFYFF